MAVWTAPTTRSTGALVSASIWNTDIVENLKYLKDSPVFDGSPTVSGRLKAATTMSVGNATPSTSGAGITFPAAQSASSDANTLDDYEEGSWTPIISDGTNDATAGTSNGGFYTKIGNRVFFTAHVAVNTIGSVGANAHIKGLPFTSNASTSNRSGVAFGYGVSLNLAAAGRVVTGYVELNSQKIELYQWSATTGTTTIAGSEISDGAVFFISGHYQI